MNLDWLQNIARKSLKKSKSFGAILKYPPHLRKYNDLKQCGELSAVVCVIHFNELLVTADGWRLTVPGKDRKISVEKVVWRALPPAFTTNQLLVLKGAISWIPCMFSPTNQG